MKICVNYIIMNIGKPENMQPGSPLKTSRREVPAWITGRVCQTTL